MSTFLTIIASMGGVAAIIWFVTRFVVKFLTKRILQSEKAKLDKEINSHKAMLDKSKIFFQKEIDAATDFTSLLYKSLKFPRQQEEPSDEMFFFIAEEFTKVEETLEEFLFKHYVVLNTSIVSVLHECIEIARINKSNIPMNITTKNIEAGKSLYQKIKKIENDILRQVKSQTQGSLQ